MLEMLDATIFWVWSVADFAVTSGLTLPGLAPATPSVVPGGAVKVTVTWCVLHGIWRMMLAL